LKTTEIEYAKIEAEYKLQLETYERRFKTQKAMVDSLLAELEAANIKIRELKNKSYHLEV
jgi:multidrug resistance efflux pump